MEHEKKHRYNRPFKCGVCGEVFSQAKGLTQHHNQHNKIGTNKRSVNKRSVQCENCPKTFTISSHLLRHKRLHCKQTPHTKAPESVEPQQWVVVEGQCVPIKQEKKDDTTNLSIKQENQDMRTVVKGQCVPVKRKMTDDAGNLPIKQENEDI